MVKNIKKKCECGCKNYAQVVHKDLYTNIKTFLCKNCEISYVMTALSNEQFFALLKNGHKTNEFMFHSDFYEFENDEDFNKVKKRVAKMTDSEMQYLASKLADDYCEQLFWGSLRTIFEDEFMNETKHDGG